MSKEEKTGLKLSVLIPVGATTLTLEFIGAYTQFAVSSTYVGQVIARPYPWQDYGPTIMFHDGLYRMWWCSREKQGSPLGEYIWYADSKDGFYWEHLQPVLTPSPSGKPDSGNVGDPTVIFNTGARWYQMYYCAMPMGGFGEIFLATSKDGVNWIKYPSNDNPQPLIKRSPTETIFGVGQPSAVWYNNMLHLYYSDSSYGDSTCTMLATSTDGVNFVLKGSVFDGVTVSTNRDIKYIPSLGILLMLYGDPTPGKIFWNISKDGVNWMPHDDARTIATTPGMPSHSAGILGDEECKTTSNTVAYHASGTSPETWNIHASKITISRVY